MNRKGIVTSPADLLKGLVVGIIVGIVLAVLFSKGILKIPFMK